MLLVFGNDFLKRSATGMTLVFFSYMGSNTKFKDPSLPNYLTIEEQTDSYLFQGYSLSRIPFFRCKLLRYVNLSLKK